MNMQSCT